MRIRKLDQQRQSDHKEFIKKAKDSLSDIKDLKDHLIKMTNEQEAKLIFDWRNTQDIWTWLFSELQETILNICWSISSKKSIDEILTILKDIYNHLTHLAILTTNDLNGQILTQFNKTFSMLKDLQALFEENGKSSSSKGEKIKQLEIKQFKWMKAQDSHLKLKNRSFPQGLLIKLKLQLLHQRNLCHSLQQNLSLLCPLTIPMTPQDMKT